MLPRQQYDPPAGAVLRLGNRVQGRYPTGKLSGTSSSSPSNPKSGI